jgi:exo-beta-1,3-glucanase (GH17 family)
MMPNWLRALPRTPQRTLQRTLAAAMTVALAATFTTACGGGGYTPTAVSQSDRRELPQSYVTRAAVNYSPYRTSRGPADLAGEVITPANVLQDLRLVQATGIGTIRLFSSRAFSQTVLEVIRDNRLDLKVQLGIWISPVNNAAAEADNQAEIAKGVALATQFRSLVDVVSVGNETMVEWSTHKVAVADMARYLAQVRQAVPQPITTNDNFLFWKGVPNAIAEIVDFAAVHTYPFLDTFYNPTVIDWRQKSVPADQRAAAMVAAAVDLAKSQVAEVRSALDSLNLTDLPLVIGETGWTAVDTAGGPSLAFRAHPVNQKMYFDAMQAWAIEGRKDRHGPKAVFFFQAFDEPWKQGDDGWGLFNTNREARYVVQGLGTCGVTWACEPGAYTAADAVKWVLPTLAAPVTAQRYTLFADAVTTGEVRAAGLRWDPFALTGYREFAGGPASSDGGVHFEIAPNPVDFGWGLFLYSGTGVLENLSNFASGRLNFQVRSDFYPGKIEVGISTDTEDRDIQEAFLQIGPGEIGYCNNNSWCQVSIPIADFVARNPKLDLRYVSFRFVVADRFSFTGKPLNQTGLPLLRIDNLHWSR